MRSSRVKPGSPGAAAGGSPFAREIPHSVAARDQPPAGAIAPPLHCHVVNCVSGSSFCRNRHRPGLFVLRSMSILGEIVRSEPRPMRISIKLIPPPEDQ